MLNKKILVAATLGVSSLAALAPAAMADGWNGNRPTPVRVDQQRGRDDNRGNDRNDFRGADRDDNRRFDADDRRFDGDDRRFDRPVIVQRPVIVERPEYRPADVLRLGDVTISLNGLFCK